MCWREKKYWEVVLRPFATHILAYDALNCRFHASLPGNFRSDMATDRMFGLFLQGVRNR